MTTTENKRCRITEKSIGGTVYIVESLESDNAKETAYHKIKRLILSNMNEAEKLSKQTQISSEIDSTS